MIVSLTIHVTDAPDGSRSNLVLGVELLARGIVSIGYEIRFDWTPSPCLYFTALSVELEA